MKPALCVAVVSMLFGVELAHAAEARIVPHDVDQTRPERRILGRLTLHTHEGIVFRIHPDAAAEQ